MPKEYIAHYKITAKLGHGGMGEVFRATDTKLNREVAIKFLSESFTRGKERVARFEREAKVLASLNHPNIAAIYGIEQCEDAHALVLELVEGETLAARLTNGPLAVEEALEAGKQIAEALEAAHGNGIVHRDLKPGNVKFTQDGKIKVLDFGLAKATGEEPLTPTVGGQSDSPTIPDYSTKPGTILGTAAYMSPEQARGKPVDKRTDIWSFGCVLYETLTGKCLFKGDEFTDTLARILEREPDWSALPNNTPPAIRLLLRKCLMKDPRRRLQDIGDARIDLELARAVSSDSENDVSIESLHDKGRRSRGRKLILNVCAVLAAVALAWFLKPSAPRTIRVLDVSLGLPDDYRLAAGEVVQISPDGDALAFIASSKDGVAPNRFYLKRLDERSKPVVLTAADGVSQFCFSHDGEWIAFTVSGDNVLRKMPTSAGSAAIPLGESGSTAGIHWTKDDTIVFGAAFQENDGIRRVSAKGGGEVESLTIPSDSIIHGLPQALPDGKSLLFTLAGPNIQTQQIAVKRLDEETIDVLARGAGNARYLESTGHLLFVRAEPFQKSGELVAVPFDPVSLKITGREVAVVPDVKFDYFGRAHYHVSERDGSLVYLTRTDRSGAKLEWVDREGNPSTFDLDRNEVSAFSLSPDGSRLAYEYYDGRQLDIWIKDIARSGNGERLTIDPVNNGMPVWSPGGGCIMFHSRTNDFHILSWMRSNHSGERHLLADGRAFGFAGAWHPEGKFFAFVGYTHQTGLDIRTVELTGSDEAGWAAGETRDFLTTKSNETDPSFSPDGKWLAYMSDESEQPEVYVRPFGRIGTKTRISVSGLGSRRPLWSTNSELIFAAKEIDDPIKRHIYIARYKEVDGQFTLEEDPVRWPGGTFDQAEDNPGMWCFDLHPDGKRLLVRRLTEDSDPRGPSDHVVWHQNFAELLRRNVPAGGE